MSYDNGNDTVYLGDDTVKVYIKVITYNEYIKRIFVGYKQGICLKLNHYNYGSSQLANFEVYVPKTFQETTEGLLGNFDGNASNEFYDDSGEPFSTYVPWKTSPDRYEIKYPENYEELLHQMIETSCKPFPSTNIVYTSYV